MQPLSWDYTRLEFERKFLVDPSALDFNSLQPYSKAIEDRYFEFGRLRLRRQTESDSGEVKFKLTKKFEPSSPHCGRIVSVWLSEPEYEALVTLPGRRLQKRRHYFCGNGFTYGVDVFSGNLSGLLICEFEGGDEAELFAIPAPSFATVEVTADTFFTGGNLCRVSKDELAQKLTTKIRAGKTSGP